MHKIQAQSPLERALDRPWLLPTASLTLTQHTWHERPVTLVRDDLLHPWAGGNKLRKLDAIWPKLKAAKIEHIITCGGVQSAHCAAVAALAAADHITAHLLTRGQPPSPPTGHALISALFGQVHAISHDDYADREGMLQRFHDALPYPTDKLMILPEGARSVDAIWGFVRLSCALIDQLGDEQPTLLLIDSATGTSALGLALGLALKQATQWRVEAVELVPHDHANTLSAIDDLNAQLAQALGLAQPLTPPLQWADRPLKRRFGKVSPEDMHRCVQIARATGVLVDPLYTVASWERLEQLPHPTDTRYIIVHTGGGLNLMGAASRWPKLWEQACIQDVGELLKRP